jgi:hypothetical protein
MITMDHVLTPIPSANLQRIEQRELGRIVAAVAR